MSDEGRIDHLKEAKGQLEAGCFLLDDGRVQAAAMRIGVASVHAQIAQAEQLGRIADLLDGTTTGSP